MNTLIRIEKPEKSNEKKLAKQVEHVIYEDRQVRHIKKQNNMLPSILSIIVFSTLAFYIGKDMSAPKQSSLNEEIQKQIHQNELLKQQLVLLERDLSKFEDKIEKINEKKHKEINETIKERLNQKISTINQLNLEVERELAEERKKLLAAKDRLNSIYKNKIKNQINESKKPKLITFSMENHEVLRFKHTMQINELKQKQKAELENLVVSLNYNNEEDLALLKEFKQKQKLELKKLESKLMSQRMDFIRNKVTQVNF